MCCDCISDSISLVVKGLNCAVITFFSSGWRLESSLYLTKGLFFCLIPRDEV